MSQISLRGKINAENRDLILNIKLPVTSPGVVTLVFIVPDDESSQLGVTLMLTRNVTEYRIQMTFSPLGNYIIEIYVLQTQNNSTEWCILENCHRKKFQVPRCNEEDVTICIEFSDENKSYFPLSSTNEEHFQLSIDHKPDSKYIIKDKRNFEHDHLFIIILKVPKSRLNFFVFTGKRLKHKIPFDLPAGVECDIKIISGTKIIENDDSLINRTEVNSKCLTFHTYFTKSEYQMLYDKMMVFITTRKLGTFLQIDYFYRNKSEIYYSSIMEYHDGIMKPYTKDHNGDPCSVINGSIRGLFFSTMIDFRTNKPPPVSLFGPIRLHIEATTFLTPNLNLYFGDFYCHYQVHYVKCTIIATPKRSPTDRFCSKRLLQLDIFSNPFIYLKECYEDIYEVMVYSCCGIRIEMFYTEPVHIREIVENHMGFFKRVAVIGKGESTPGGITKNKNCKICNV